MVGEETVRSEWWLLLQRQRDALLAVAWVMDGAEGWSLTDSSWDTDSDGDANSVDIEGKAAVEAFGRRRRQMMAAVHELGGWTGWWVTTCVAAALTDNFTEVLELWDCLRRDQRAALLGVGKIVWEASEWRKAEWLEGGSDSGSDCDSGDKMLTVKHRNDEWHLTSRGLRSVWEAMAAAAGGSASIGFWLALRSWATEPRVLNGFVERSARSMRGDVDSVATTVARADMEAGLVG
jgi:hypothetical protein